jgi:hypothetical protein
MQRREVAGAAGDNRQALYCRRNKYTHHNKQNKKIKAHELPGNAVKLTLWPLSFIHLHLLKIEEGSDRWKGQGTQKDTPRKVP